MEYWKQDHRIQEESLATGRFRLIAFDEVGGVQRTQESLRLVCLTDSGGKLAIWGSEDNRRNIDIVLGSGLPCIVQCDYIEPGEWALVHGQSYWVPESSDLRIAKPAEVLERNPYVQ